MSQQIHFVLLAFSLVCFAFASWQQASPVWNRIVSIGLAFLVLSMLPW